jgi:hypothetical protein
MFMCGDVIKQQATTVGKRWWEIMIPVNNTMVVVTGLAEIAVQDAEVVGSQIFGAGLA